MERHGTNLHILPAAGRLAVLILALAGCDSRTGPASDARDPGAGKDAGARRYRVAVVPKGTTHIFWKSIHAGALTGARNLKEKEGLDVEVIWQGPQVEDEREAQRQVIETFTGRSDLDGIVFAPIDEHVMVAPVNQAMAAGKPVVIIDSGIKGNNYVSFVATDNYKGGVLAAERLGELMQGKGKALLLRYQQGSASTDQREKGFIETLQRKHPAIELVPPGLQQYAGATVGRAQEASETLLNTYPDTAGIFCPNESSATGMLQALQKTGRAGKVFFVGFDANDKLVEAMSAGTPAIHGLILQNPVRMGALGVETLVHHIRGQKVEPRIDTGVHLITKDNMNIPEMRTLLKPDLSIVDR